MSKTHIFMILVLILIPNFFLLWVRFDTLRHLVFGLKTRIEYGYKHYLFPIPNPTDEEINAGKIEFDQETELYKARIIKETVIFVGYAGIILSFTFQLVKYFLL